MYACVWVHYLVEAWIKPMHACVWWINPNDCDFKYSFFFPDFSSEAYGHRAPFLIILHYFLIRRVRTYGCSSLTHNGFDICIVGLHRHSHSHMTRSILFPEKKHFHMNTQEASGCRHRFSTSKCHCKGLCQLPNINGFNDLVCSSGRCAILWQYE